MKNHYYLFIFFISSFCFSQSKDQRLVIVRNTDTEGLIQLSTQFNSDYLKRKEIYNSK